MRAFWLYPLVGLLWLASGCAADAGKAGAGAEADARIAATLIEVMQAEDPRAAAGERGLEVSTSGVRVDVQTQGLEPADRGGFDLPGVQVHSFSPGYERVSVSVRDLDALRALAGLAPVRRIAPAWGAVRDGATGGG